MSMLGGAGFKAKIKASKKLLEERRKSRKRAAAGDNDEDKEDEEEEEDLLAAGDNGEAKEQESIKLDLAFCDSKGEDDEMWIRTLLQKGWTGKCVLENKDAELRRVAGVISQQVQCGTFIKTDSTGTDADDGAIYAFMSVLDAEQHLPRGVLAKLPPKQAGSGKLGWLVRERIVNLPQDTTFPLLDCLVKDLAHAETEAGGRLCFDSVLLLAPCYFKDNYNNNNEEEGAAAPHKKLNKKQRLAAQAQAQASSTTAEYYLFEDAVFANSATSKTLVRFSRPTVAEDVDEMPDFNLPLAAHALVLTKQAFEACVQSLEGI